MSVVQVSKHIADNLEVSLVKFNNTFLRQCLLFLFLVPFPLILALSILRLWHWDFSIPLIYGNPGADDIWQLVTTKTLLDTGWVFENPYLGAPGISQWYNNSSAQTSAIHSIVMLSMSYFEKDAVKVQQYYFVLNFSLITITSFVVCRTFSISRLFSVLVGLLFAFASFRFRYSAYAFIPNYFIVPLSLIPIIWILQGKLSYRRAAPADNERVGSVFSNAPLLPRSIASLLIVISIAASDGYYAFFTLLLLSLAIALRVINEKSASAPNILIPVALIVVLLATVLALLAPIRSHRALHPEETSQDQLKQPAEAEIYSPSLKMLVAPIYNHRINYLADFGKWMVETGNFNRKFPIINGAPSVLGFLGTLLLAGSFLALAGSALDIRVKAVPLKRAAASSLEVPSLYMITCVLSLFVLLCSMTGGVGSLIALMFPSIRAYDRFPMYLLLLLYVGAASVATSFVHKSERGRGAIFGCFIILVSFLSILDQSPADNFGTKSRKNSALLSSRFLAERSFVQAVEASLPPKAMVYNYPYSQFVTNNKYYGWGSFGQMRLYLHSHALRWSNGGAKGSPIENWHERQSLLPLPQLVTEMQAVGFEAFVADRLVLPQAEYEAVRVEMRRLTGREPLEDDVARLAFWKLDSVPIRLDYGSDYRNAERLVVARPWAAHQALPRIVNRIALEAALAGKTDYPVVLERKSYPEVFRDGAQLDRGFGQVKITPFSDVKGGISCEGSDQISVLPDSPISLSIVNRSEFDWQFNSGPYPMRIGIQIFDNNKLMPEERRVLTDAFVEPGGNAVVPYSLSEIFSRFALNATGEVEVRFSLLQEGNAWFQQPSNDQCRVTVRR